MKKRYLFVATLFFLTGSVLAASKDKQPNIVLIMADDMGYECLSSDGSLDYKTPHLDSLGSQGIRFKHCYSLPLCTPSRVKIMTGRYSYRNYERFGLLPTSETTFGKRLQDAGYLTAMVGKWQLGGDWKTPIQFGFDEYCLQNGINPREPFDRSTRGRSRYWGYPPIVANGELYESKKTYGPDMLNEYAVNFIKKEKDKPFFLYYPMLLTHSPFEPSPLTPGQKGKDGKTSEVRYFKDMVEYTDRLVGNIVRALEESGQRENTIIFFTGDNGTTYPVGVTDTNPDIRRIATDHGRVGALVEAGQESPKSKSKNNKFKYIEGPVTRTTYGDVPGGKDLMRDNGTHVPLIVSWPLHSAAHKKMGNESGDLIDFSDFFATLIELAGASQPEDCPIDGVSFASRLKGQGASPRQYIFCHYWGFGRDPKAARDAIHDGHWKLYNDGSFFDLASDKEEKAPLSPNTMSEPAKQAHKRLTQAYEELRGISIPNNAPSKMLPQAENSNSNTGVLTLEQQLAKGKERAKKLEKKFDPVQTTRYFRAKDRNSDGLIDEAEAKIKVPKGWNDKK